MDEKIFVKEQAESPKSKTLALGILAAILLLVGVVGLIVLLTSKQNAPSVSPTVTPTTGSTVSPSVTTTATVKASPTATPTASPSGTVPVYKAPADTTKINIYFPKTPETDQNSNYYVPVLRDKPSTSLEAFTINQLLSGLTADEKAAGYKVTWSFASSSNCAGKTYKYSISGKTLKIELCREFTGSSTEHFLNALKYTFVEQGKVTKVAVLTPSGDCLGLPAGDKSCL